MSLSREDRGSIMLAVTIAIAHEREVISRLEGDQEFHNMPGCIQERRDQIERFERLFEKLKHEFSSLPRS